MTDMNGIELIQQARKTHPGLSAVIITGYAEVTDTLPDGVVVLGKTISRHAPVDALRNAIGVGTDP